MMYGARHRLHGRARGGKKIIRRRRHHRQRASLSTREPARDRGVDHADAGAGEPITDGARLGRPDGGCQHDDPPTIHSRRQPVFTQDHILCLITIHDHHKDDIGMASDVANARAGHTSHLGKLRHTRLAEVKTAGLEPIGDQVFCQT